MPKFFVAIASALTFPLWSTSADAQTRIAFEGVDRDANSQLSRFEFAELPGFYGGPRFFGELDRDRDGFVSRDEWTNTFPDANGLRGIARQVSPGTERAKPPTFLAHGPSVPREKNEEVSLETLRPKPRAEWPALTGHGGSDGKKPRVAQMPPIVNPDEPPLIPIPPRKRP